MLSRALLLACLLGGAQAQPPIKTEGYENAQEAKLNVARLNALVSQAVRTRPQRAAAGAQLGAARACRQPSPHTCAGQQRAAWRVWQMEGQVPEGVPRIPGARRCASGAGSCALPLRILLLWPPRVLCPQLRLPCPASSAPSPALPLSPARAVSTLSPSSPPGPRRRMLGLMCGAPTWTPSSHTTCRTTAPSVASTSFREWAVARAAGASAPTLFPPPSPVLPPPAPLVRRRSDLTYEESKDKVLMKGPPEDADNTGKGGLRHRPPDCRAYSRHNCPPTHPPPARGHP